jgi:hypothetical protein
MDAVRLLVVGRQPVGDEMGPLSLGESILFQYEPGKFVEATVVETLEHGSCRVRIAPPRFRFASPLTERGTFEGEPVLVARASQITRLRRRPEFDAGLDDLLDGD